MKYYVGLDVGHVWTAPCWQGIFWTMMRSWSVLPCVRPYMRRTLSRMCFGRVANMRYVRLM